MTDEDAIDRVSLELRDPLVGILERYRNDPDEAVALYVVGAFAAYFLEKHHGYETATRALAAWALKLQETPSTSGVKH